MREGDEDGLNCARWTAVQHCRLEKSTRQAVQLRACSVKFLIEIILPKKKMLDSSYFPNYSMWRLRFLLNNRILLELSQNSVL